MLNVTLLGSGGGMPIPDRHLFSTVLNYKGRQILIDCGEGSQVAIRKNHSGFKSIDIICITHFHGDHIFGLPGLLSTMGNSGREKPITIIGPSGLKEIIKGLLSLVSYLPYDIKLIEISEDRLYLSISSGILQVVKENKDRQADIILSTLELDHSSICIGYSFYILRNPKFHPEKAMELDIPKKYWSLLQNGKEIIYKDKIYKPKMVLGEERKGIKLSYITDTRPINKIIDFIDGSDLFICEGTYGDNEDIKKAEKNKHMTFSEAAELARKGNVGELLLSHFSTAMNKPELYKENARQIFKDTIIGYDGYKKLLSYE